MAATTVALLPYALGTLDDVLKYLADVPTPTGGDLQMVNRIINSATLRVEAYCRRVFLTRSITEYHDGKGNLRLYLRNQPVLTVTQIDWLDYQGTSMASYTGSDLVVDDTHGIVTLSNGGSFATGMRNWKVQYTASYASLTTVPDPVVLAFFKLCKQYYMDWQHQKDDITSQTIDGQTTFFENAKMPNRIASLLKPYQIPVGMYDL